MRFDNIKKTIIAFLAVGTVGLLAPSAEWCVANDPPQPKPIHRIGFGDQLPEGAIARMGTARFWHEHQITFVAYVAKAREIVTAATDGRFRVWDADTGVLLRQFGSGRRTPVTYATTSSVLSSDGKTLADLQPTGHLTLWNLTTGEMLVDVPPKTEVPLEREPSATSLDFSPDGKTLALRIANRPIQVHEVPSGKLVGSFGTDFPDSARVAVSGSLNFLNDGKWVMSINRDAKTRRSEVFIHEIQTGKLVHSYRTPDLVFKHHCIAISADRNVLAVGGTEGPISLLEAKTGKVLRRLAHATKDSKYRHLRFSPDGKTMVATETSISGKTISPDGTVHGDQTGVAFWDVETGKETARIVNWQKWHPSVVTNQPNVASGLAFSPDGKNVAENFSGRTLRILSVPVGDVEKHSQVPGHVAGITQMALSRDGKTLTTNAGNVVIHWDLASGREKQRIQIPNFDSWALISHHGERAAYWGLADPLSVRLHVWDLHARKELTTLFIPTKEMQTLRPPLAFSRDGAKLVILNKANEVLVYEAIPKGKRIAHLTNGKESNVSPMLRPQPRMIRLSPTGNALATSLSQDHDAKFWELDSREPLNKEMKEFTGQWFRDVCFNANGQYVALTKLKWETSVIEIATGKELAHIAPNSDSFGRHIDLDGFSLPALALSPNGLFLATGGKLVRLYNLATGTEVAKFSGHRADVSCLQFGSDGKTLISGSHDTTALVWDISKFVKPPPPKQPWSVEERELIWSDLAGDPKKAAGALLTLESDPKQAVVLLRDKLKPAPDANVRDISKLVTDLASANFVVRTKAQSGLEKLGSAALPALQEALAKKPDTETTRRVEQLLDKIVAKTSAVDLIRGHRIVYFLAQTEHSDSVSLLRELANGNSRLPLAGRAKRALNTVLER